MSCPSALYNRHPVRRMPFTLSHATPADAARIAEIHFATFSPNGMFRAFFPAPEIRIAMQKPLEGKILEEIESPKMTVLIVRASPVTKALDAAPNGNLFHSDNKAELSGEGKIIAFAKWAHPIAEDDQLIEGTTWKWPEGTDWEVLKGWTRKTEEAQERALGAAPCWRTFI